MKNICHHDLKLVNELAYLPSGLELKSIKIDSESKEYGAATFTLNDKKINFRIAKVTPTKVGHFVAIWKR